MLQVFCDEKCKDAVASMAIPNRDFLYIDTQF